MHAKLFVPLACRTALSLAPAPRRALVRRMSSRNPVLDHLTTEELFQFDLNGYVIVRGALNAAEIADIHTAIDAHVGEAISRSPPQLRNAKEESAFGAKGSRRDLGGMLGWEEDCFRKLIAHPKLAKYVTAMCGEGYRLDHQPLVLIQDKASEGFSLHGGPISGEDGQSAGVFNPELQYRCVNGQPWSSLLAMSVHIVDAPEDAGGFCVVKGSHKLNFPVPAHYAAGGDLDFAKEHVYQPQTKAGDVIFFSEATVHGALPWRQDYERRLALFRFAPANFGYGRAYLNEWGAGTLDRCTPAQRAVLQPPFAARLERDVSTALGDSGPPPEKKKRMQSKKDHDRAVFGSDFF
ncbi:hypothetical protein M885DRAFT_506573 [Pelagophyceae sp. CCMP2097]|nr:hypothetical protein M885DRAFT_506573 [Pelagophyceae sp. CCMP2097]